MKGVVPVEFLDFHTRKMMTWPVRLEKCPYVIDISTFFERALRADESTFLFGESVPDELFTIKCGCQVSHPKTTGITSDWPLANRISQLVKKKFPGRTVYSVSSLKPLLLDLRLFTERYYEGKVFARQFIHSLCLAFNHYYIQEAQERSDVIEVLNSLIPLAERYLDPVENKELLSSLIIRLEEVQGKAAGSRPR